MAEQIRIMGLGQDGGQMTREAPVLAIAEKFQIDVDFSQIKSIADHLIGLTFPVGFFVTRAYYKVQTTFTSATDAATIAIGFLVDDVAGIKAAVAISNGANPWDAGNVEGIQTGTAANFGEVLTAARQVCFTTGVEVLTAGRLTLYIEGSHTPA